MPVPKKKYPPTFPAPKPGPKAINLPPIPRHSSVVTTTGWEDIVKDMEAETALQSVLSLQKNASAQLDAIDALRASRDPSVGVDTHHHTVGKRALETANRIHNRAKLVDADLAKREASLIAQWDEQRAQYDQASLAEIRGVLRSMSDKQRVQTLETALQARDTKILAAVIDQHGMTSGLTEQQRAAYSRRAHAAIRPDDAAVLERVRKAKAMVASINDGVVRYAADATSTPAYQAYVDAHGNYQRALEQAMREN